MDSTAALIATVPVEEAEARDWEALDIGGCPAAVDAPPWCLYIADTGDNGRRRESVTVYVVAEPDPFAAVPAARALGAVRFAYDRGPLDSEALAVTPEGDLLIATKGRSGASWLYRVEAADVARASRSGETLTLTAPTRIPIQPDFALGRWLTGASLDADGTLLALRTYTEVYFYAWPVRLPGEQLVEAAPVCFLGPLEPIGEAIAFSADDRIYLTSESPGVRTGHLLEIVCTGVGTTSGDR
jgi:hypothetical protein